MANITMILAGVTGGTGDYNPMPTHIEAAALVRFDAIIGNVSKFIARMPVALTVIPISQGQLLTSVTDNLTLQEALLPDHDHEALGKFGVPANATLSTISVTDVGTLTTLANITG